MSGDFSGKGRGGKGGGLADVRAETLEKDSLCRTKAHFSANFRRRNPILERKVLQSQPTPPIHAPGLLARHQVHP
jgi:hypothetical protein